MSLFTGNLRRSVGAGVASILTGTFLMWTFPSNMRAFTLAQTSVAILAIGSLMVFIVAHHRRNGQLFTQDQEEMILIGPSASSGSVSPKTDTFFYYHYRIHSAYLPTEERSGWLWLLCLRQRVRCQMPEGGPSVRASVKCPIFLPWERRGPRTAEVPVCPVADRYHM
ncbi:hypothetical protein BJV77DRAFT_584010 [Russula vinacea]|nr:hypothetical protein BJV77DRAFT_584010 [Russula vinacea]